MPRALRRPAGRSTPIAERLRIIREAPASHRGKCGAPRDGCSRGESASPARREARLRSPSACRCVPLAGAKARPECSRRGAAESADVHSGCRAFRSRCSASRSALVLVIGPGNYPLFLPAVQTLHALVAGNAVLLKPAPGTREVALAFAQLARDAGFDPALLTILPESVAAAARRHR